MFHKLPEEVVCHSLLPYLEYTLSLLPFLRICKTIYERLYHRVRYGVLCEEELVRVYSYWGSGKDRLLREVYWELPEFDDPRHRKYSKLRHGLVVEFTNFTWHGMHEHWPSRDNVPCAWYFMHLGKRHGESRERSRTDECYVARYRHGLLQERREVCDTASRRIEVQQFEHGVY